MAKRSTETHTKVRLISCSLGERSADLWGPLTTASRVHRGKSPPNVSRRRNRAKRTDSALVAAPDAKRARLDAIAQKLLAKQEVISDIEGDSLLLLAHFVTPLCARVTLNAVRVLYVRR